MHRRSNFKNDSTADAKSPLPFPAAGAFALQKLCAALTASRLGADALGFDGIDAGRLADSWRQHPGTPAYCRDLDTDGLKAALTQADAGQIANYRAQADEIARPYFA